MHFLQLFAYIVFFSLKKSQSANRKLCEHLDPVISVCTQTTRTVTTIYLNTDLIPKEENVSCTCLITNYASKIKLNFRIVEITERKKMRFEIKGKVLDKETSSYQLYIKDSTELKLFTHGILERKGACLAIYSNGNATFKITCTMPSSSSSSSTTTTKNSQFLSTTATTKPVHNSTTKPCQGLTTTTKPNPSSTTSTKPSQISTTTMTEHYITSTEENRSKISPYLTTKTKPKVLTTVRPSTITTLTKDFTQTIVSPKKSNDNENKNTLVSLVSGISGFIVGLSTGFICYFCCKRIRTKKERKEPDTQNTPCKSLGTESKRNSGEIRSNLQSIENIYNQIELEESSPSQTNDCINVLPVTKGKQAFVKETEECIIYNSTMNTTSKPFQDQEKNVYDHLEAVGISELCSNNTYNTTGNPL